MSARFLCCVSLLCLAAAPAALLPSSASADTLVIPGITTLDRTHPRPRYRDRDFPPPQYDLLKRRVALDRRARPTYRQADNDFPPPGGRFGGGFLEYVLTGGRPEPIAPDSYAPSGPVSPSPVARFFSPGPYAAPNPGPLSPYPLPSLPSLSPSTPTPSSALPRSASLPSLLPAGGLPAALPGITQDPPQQMFAPQPGFAPQPAYAPQAYAPQAYAPQAYAPQAYAPQVVAEPQPTLFNLPGFPDAAPQPYAGAQALAVEPGSRPADPIYERQETAYDGAERPGTVIIDTPRKFLFLVRPGGRALRYGIGVGRPGFEWAGIKRISRKAEWPGWTPPPEMLKRRPDLPRHMVGGEANPLGARALYLGSSMYRIHGTNEPSTIGTNVSSGCIRMMNPDVIDLYGRVGVGTRVVVL